MLRGAWRKPDAEYLGTTHARKRAPADRGTRGCTRDDRRIDRKTGAGKKSDRDTIRPNCRERAGAPSVAQLQRAPTNWRSAESASADARQLLDEIDQLLSKAVEAEHDTRDTRDRDAADLGLTQWKETKRTREVGVTPRRCSCESCSTLASLDSLQGARSALGNATEREAESQVSLDVAAGRLEEARKLAACGQRAF